MVPTSPRAFPPRGLRVEDARRAQAEMFGEPLWEVAPKPAPEPAVQPEPAGWERWLGRILPAVAIGMVALTIGMGALLSLVALGYALLR